MRVGRVEEAGALAAQIGKDITRRLSRINGKTDVKGVWSAVQKLTGRKQELRCAVEGITAHSLNSHYAAISPDNNYCQPLYKHTASENSHSYISEWRVFRILDDLQPTSTKPS